MLRTNLNLQQRPRRPTSNSVMFWHRSSCHGLVQENKWQNPFLKVTKWFEARLYQQTLDLGVLPATSFMLSFFVYRITEATISHSPLILKKKKNISPWEAFRCCSFPTYSFSCFHLCITRSVQIQVNSANNFLAFLEAFHSVIFRWNFKAFQ